MSIEAIIFIVYFGLMIPFMAFFKALFEKQYIGISDDSHVYAGLFWPASLALMIIGQLLYVLISGIFKAYEWMYKFFEKHI